MNPLSIQLDEEARRMAQVLAEKWGLPKQRYISRVLLRCLERVYQREIGIDANDPLAPDQTHGIRVKHIPPHHKKIFAQAFEI